MSWEKSYHAKVYINIVGGLIWKVPVWKTNRWIKERYYNGS
jgi:hypothetical protein